MRRRILLVGATGVFGACLAMLLAEKRGIELILAARSLPALLALQALIEEKGPPAEVALVDRRKPDLSPLRPWLVIDAAGPFQHSGYDLALAAVGAGAHYVDLADARAFVAGFCDAVDEVARGAGVLAATGASSTPALSHAALARVTAGWRRLDEVVVATSPGARASRPGRDRGDPELCRPTCTRVPRWRVGFRPGLVAAAPADHARSRPPLGVAM